MPNQNNHITSPILFNICIINLHMGHSVSNQLKIKKFNFFLRYKKKRKGVIRQRRPTKNWLFEPPPCPTSSVWQTPPPPPISDVRTVSSVKKTSETLNILRCGRPWMWGGCHTPKWTSETPNFSVSGRPVDGRPPRPRLSTLAHTPPPISTGHLWWMAPYTLHWHTFYVFPPLASGCPNWNVSKLLHSSAQTFNHAIKFIQKIKDFASVSKAHSVCTEAKSNKLKSVLIWRI